VTGDLTIKGVTKPRRSELEYTGTAVEPDGNTRVCFEGNTTVNHRD
jgi:polyisoprenoid-binding protein YceI